VSVENFSLRFNALALPHPGCAGGLLAAGSADVEISSLAVSFGKMLSICLPLYFFILIPLKLARERRSFAALVLCILPKRAESQVYP
jgi:hypothetical protein